MVAVITSRVGPRSACGLSDESRIAAPNQQSRRRAVKFLVWQRRCFSQATVQKGFCTDHVETYERPLLDADSHSQP